MWLVLLFQPFKNLRVVSGIRTYKTSGDVEVVDKDDGVSVGSGPIGFLPIFQTYDDALEFADGDTARLQEIEHA